MKRPMVYAFYGADDDCLYVGATENLGARIVNHGNGRPWWPEVARISAVACHDLTAARELEAQWIELLAPKHNKIRSFVTPPAERYDGAAARDVFTVADAARQVGKSPRTILRWIKAEKIAAIKLGPGTAAYVIARAEVERIQQQDAA